MLSKIMNYTISLFVISFLITSNIVFGYSASEFTAKYHNQFSEGEKVKVLIKVKGEPVNKDPAKLAREIRYYQAGVLKFIHLAGAINVISDTKHNQFSAIMTTSLAEKIATRYDIISVTKIDTVDVSTQLCFPIEPGANLSGCDLYAARLRNADLRGVNLTNANLKGADLTGADLSGADLRSAFLKYAQLDETNLSNVNFSFAKLIRADITNANLTNASFYGATLYQSDFTNSDLTNVDFRFSILTYANLSFTNLDGVNFESAGTWGTNLNQCRNHEFCEEYNISYAKEKNFSQEKTIVELFPIRSPNFNGGEPIVFSGRLYTESGQKITHAEILIKSDGPCPSDGIIAKTTTDKYGDYSIQTLTKIWDPYDNLINIHAEFSGNEKLAPSSSQNEVVVVFPKNAESCK